MRRLLAFHVANESVVASLGRIRFVSSLLVGGCWELGWLVAVFGGCASLLAVVSVRLPMGFWFELAPPVGGCGGKTSDQGGEAGREPSFTACVVTLAWPRESLESRVLAWRGAPSGA